MRQSTVREVPPIISVISKLPMRQSTIIFERLERLGFSKLPMRQST